MLTRFGRNAEQGCQEYVKFVREGANQGNRPELVGGGLRRSCGAWLERPGRRRGEEEDPPAYDERVLGSSEFVKDLLAEADWERRQALRKTCVSLVDLAARVLSVTGLPDQDLRSNVKRPTAVAARRAFTQLAVREYGDGGAAVARYLGVVASTAQRQGIEGELSPLAERIRRELPR